MNARKFKELDETIYDVLEAIRRRPTMYIDEPSIRQLHVFLGGYTGGLGRVGYALRGESLRRFNEWIGRRLGFPEPTSGWCNMIRAKSLSDEDAFKRFFLLLDEFKKQPA